MPGFVLRRATLDDAERLALVGAATFLETFAGVLDGDAIVAHCQRHHSRAAWRGLIEAGCAAWLALTIEGTAPVGHALAGPPDLPGAEAGDMELKRIYALSRFHGTGLGEALMRAVLDHARAAGARRLLLGVYAGNGRALAFYRRHGFADFTTRRFLVGDRFYDDRVLARTL